MADPMTRPYIDSTAQLHTSFLSLRCDAPPLDDVRVRRALNHAIDRHRLNERCLLGTHRPRVVDPAAAPPGHDPNLRPFRHDPERARALIAEAGFSDLGHADHLAQPEGRAGPGNPMSHASADLAKARRQGRAEVLTGEEMTAEEAPGEFPHFRLTRWFADFPDPDNFFSSLFYSKTEDVLDFGFRKRRTGDRPDGKGARATDGKEREAICRELDRLVETDAPVVFLFHNRGFVRPPPGTCAASALYPLPPPVRWTDLSFER